MSRIFAIAKYIKSRIVSRCYNLGFIICTTSALVFGYSFIFAEENIVQIFRKQYSVIMICVDTLRADHLGCYGYSRNTSPNIDKLAEGGILFEQAISQSNRTLSSHASIFTSEYVPVHGVYFFNRLPDSEVTLGSMLKNNGYKTAAFTGKGNVRAIFGLNKGFDIFDDGASMKEWSRSFKDTIPLAVKWLKANKDSKFFLFLHGYDIHSPYHSKYEHIFDPGYRGIVDSENIFSGLEARISRGSFLNKNDKLVKLVPKDIDHIIAHYDGGIRYADENIGNFMMEISKLGILDKTIIILLSDHGDELFERGHVSRHGSNPYDEAIRVPLIIRHPQVKGGGVRIKTQAQLIDVMPTILDSLGIPKNKEAQGSSLLSLVEGSSPPSFNKYVYSEYNIIRTLEWKSINLEKLYNLERDPKELVDLAEQNPEVLLRLNRKFMEWKQKCVARAIEKLLHQNSDLKLFKKDIEKLQDESYW